MNCGETWFNVSTPKLAALDMNHSIQFLDDQTGIILGINLDNKEGNAVILRTSDGGQNWDQTYFDDFWYYGNVKNLQVVDDSVFYFLANELCGQEPIDYILYTSADSGRNWAVRNHSLNPIYSINFLNSSTGFAYIEDSLDGEIIAQSTDGGLTWQKKYEIGSGSVSNIFFLSEKVGFMFNTRTLSKSVDGGKSWYITAINYPFKNTFFINNIYGFACGGATGGCDMGHCQPSSYGNLFSTLDGGKTWRFISTNSRADVQRNFGRGVRGLGWPFNSCYFINDVTGFLINERTILRSVNSGNSWSEVYENLADSSSYNFIKNDICFTDQQHGWIVGAQVWEDSSEAVIYATENAGDNWQLAWKYPSTDLYEFDLQSCHFVAETGWAVGSGGLVVKYTEQNQWQIQPSITDLPLRDIFFSDEQHGCIAGGYLNDQDFQSKVFLTTNAGKDWGEIKLDRYLINDIYFSDSLTGWIVGHDKNYRGTILQTVDGGEHWSTQVENLSAPLNALHFKDGYGWAVGENGLILRTDNWVEWINEKIQLPLVPLGIGLFFFLKIYTGLIPLLLNLFDVHV